MPGVATLAAEVALLIRVGWLYTLASPKSDVGSFGVGKGAERLRDSAPLITLLKAQKASNQVSALRR